MTRYNNPSDTTLMTLIFRSRLIWTQPADTLAVINSHMAAKRFVPWNWIVLLSDNARTMFADACASTHCRGGYIVRCFILVLFFVLFLFFFLLQNELPPYESRVTTAKLLIESEEYEVKCLPCVVLVHSLVVGLCMYHGGRAAWHFSVYVRVFVCFPFWWIAPKVARPCLVFIPLEFSVNNWRVVFTKRDRAKGGHIRVGKMGGRVKFKKKKKLWSDELLPYLETAYLSTKSLTNFQY